jgi:hypothetical protein
VGPSSAEPQAGRGGESSHTFAPGPDGLRVVRSCA